MSYPELIIHLDHLQHNCQTLINTCASYNKSILAICKAVTSDPNIVDAYISAGMTAIGDSRIYNLKKIYDKQVEKWLIRMPMASEIEDVVNYCHVSLQSEVSTIQLIEDYCQQNNKTHQIVLMIDLGDLREGFFDENEFCSTIDYVRSLHHVKLKGIGTNLTCLSFVIPDENNMNRLVQLAKKKNIQFISGGNSASLAFMLENKMPNEINQLRLGESLLIGKERHNYQYLPDTYHDTFILNVQIIECKIKPSYPIGCVGKNSYGITPTFIDRGLRKRAILAIGHQDIDEKTLYPIDSDIQIIDCSCDHLVIDVTDCKRDYNVGDIVSFHLGYFSIMCAFTSCYIEKKYIKKEG